MLIQSPSIDSTRIKPLHDWVFVRRCLTSPGTNAKIVDGRIEYDKGGISVSDYEGDSNTWGEILAVGPKCTGLTGDHIGFRAMCAPDGIGWNTDTTRIQGEEFFVRESRIPFIADPYREEE